LKLELIELQYDSILHSNFNQVGFYASLSVSQFSELCKLEQYLAGAFGSTSIHEQAFSCMKQNKLKFCSGIIDVHLHDVNWHFKNGTKQ
jgi:hypothetical protein